MGDLVSAKESNTGCDTAEIDICSWNVPETGRPGATLSLASWGGRGEVSVHSARNVSLVQSKHTTNCIWGRCYISDGEAADFTAGKCCTFHHNLHYLGEFNAGIKVKIIMKIPPRIEMMNWPTCAKTHWNALMRVLPNSIGTGRCWNKRLHKMTVYPIPQLPIIFPCGWSHAHING